MTTTRIFPEYEAVARWYQHPFASSYRYESGRPRNPSQDVCYLGRPEVIAGGLLQTGGNRYSSRNYVSPVTPPPDVDLAGWQTSIDPFRRWDPARLFSTHFGCSHQVGPHLDELESRLAVWSDRVRESLSDTSLPDEQQATAFAGWVAAHIRERLAPADAAAYEWGTTALNSWHGLARYWRNTTGDAPR